MYENNLKEENFKNHTKCLLHVFTKDFVAFLHIFPDHIQIEGNHVAEFIDKWVDKNFQRSKEKFLKKGVD